MAEVGTIDAQLQVDARSGALLLAEFIRRHRARGGDWGRIVTLSSGEGRDLPGEVSYGAGKAALVRELAAGDHQHHHVAAPGEVADVIAWLCAEAGRVVTGNVIRLR